MEITLAKIYFLFREQVCKQFHPVFRETTEIAEDESSNLSRTNNVNTTSSNVPNCFENRVPVAPSNRNLQIQEPLVLPSWASNTANVVVARLNSTPIFDIEGKYWVKPDFLKVLRQVEGANQTQVVFQYREVNQNILLNITRQYFSHFQFSIYFFLTIFIIIKFNNFLLNIQITSNLGKYIMQNKNQFFDMRNIRIALVENDLLGFAFGVKAFARSQVT